MIRDRLSLQYLLFNHFVHAEKIVHTKQKGHFLIIGGKSTITHQILSRRYREWKWPETDEYDLNLNYAISSAIHNNDKLMCIAIPNYADHNRCIRIVHGIDNTTLVSLLREQNYTEY